MRMANDQFRDKFKYYLRRSGYNQRELAHELNVDASTLSKWVNGDNPWPVDALATVCELLELDGNIEQELSVLAGLSLPASPSLPPDELAPHQAPQPPFHRPPPLSSLLIEHNLHELHHLLIELEENPDDPDRQATVREELKKLLAEDETVVAQIQDLLEGTERTRVGKTIIKQVAGDNSKQFGQVFGDVNL